MTRAGEGFWALGLIGVDLTLSFLDKLLMALSFSGFELLRCFYFELKFCLAFPRFFMGLLSIY